MKQMLQISIVIVLMLSCQTISINSQNNVTETPDIGENLNKPTEPPNTIEDLGDIVGSPETAIVYSDLMGIYTMSIDGKDVKQLTNTFTSGAGSLKWSPNKEQIVFQDSCSFPYLINPVGSNERPLSNMLPKKSEDGGCPQYGVEWSPESLRMAVWDRLGNFYVTNVDDGEILLQNSFLKDEFISHAVWFPDGDKIAVFGYKPVTVSIMNINDNSLLRIAEWNGLTDSVQVSPDGERIAISTSCGGDDCEDSLTVINSNGSGETQLIDSNLSYSISVLGWTPDSNNVLITMGDEQLNTTSFLQISYDGTNTIKLFEDEGVYDWGMYNTLNLSKDGKRVLYGSSTPNSINGIVVRNIDGNNRLFIPKFFVQLDW